MGIRTSAHGHSAQSTETATRALDARAEGECRFMVTQARGHAPTWLQVLMSIPPFRYSTTLSRLPALAARRKLALLSDCGKEKAVSGLHGSGRPRRGGRRRQWDCLSTAPADWTPQSPCEAATPRLSGARSPWELHPALAAPNLKRECRHCLTLSPSHV